MDRRIPRLRPACDRQAAIEKRALNVDAVAGEQRFRHGPSFCAIVAISPLKQQPPAGPLSVARLRKNLEWPREENIVAVAFRIAPIKAARLHDEREAWLPVVAPIASIPLAFVIITSRPLEWDCPLDTRAHSLRPGALMQIVEVGRAVRSVPAEVGHGQQCAHGLRRFASLAQTRIARCAGVVIGADNQA